MGFFSKIGGFFKKNWKTILGITASIVAVVAAPYIAPLIAGSSFLAGASAGVQALVGAAGTAAIGAGVGAGSAALMGQNPWLGAGLGALGGFTAGGGFGAAAGLLGAGSAAAAPAAAAPAAGLPTTFGASVAPSQAVAASTSVTAALGDSLAKAVTPQNLMKLATVMFGKDMSQLTEQEKKALREQAELAATNRGLFDKRLEEAYRMIQQGTPNPEVAFANTQMQTERSVNELTRGRPVAEQKYVERKGQIEGARLGAAAVNQDRVASTNIRLAGLQSLPGGAPAGAASMGLPIDEARQQRIAAQQEQQYKMFGDIYGSIA